MRIVGWAKAGPALIIIKTWLLEEARAGSSACWLALDTRGCYSCIKGPKHSQNLESVIMLRRELTAPYRMSNVRRQDVD